MDAYAHLRMLVSLILGLGITRLLSGLSRRIQTPERTEGMGAQLVWAAVILIGAVHFWWWEFGFRKVEVWHFGVYVFLLAYAALFFLMATLIFPDALPGHSESESFFVLRRGWFFGLFALSFGFDLVDTLMKGQEHLRALGPEYPTRLLLGLVIAVVAMRTRRPAVSMWIGLAWLAYDLSWILRHYDSLQ